MSWKSFVTAGLLCVLAIPAYAVGPTVRITNGGLNGNGDWVWNVTIQPSFDQSPIAAELGFTANREIVGTPTKGASFTGDNTENPGNVIFGWETITDLGGNGDCSSANPGECPLGLQVEPGANDGVINQIYAALGSIGDLASASEAQYLTIFTAGPSNVALTGSVELSGAYGTGSNEARVAELTSYDPGPPATGTSANYKYGTGQVASRTLKVGDIDLNGFTDGDDFGVFLGGYEPGVGGKVGGWAIGDFDRDGDVDGDDFGIFLGGYEPGVGGGSVADLVANGTLDPPAGSGGGSAVPEPASAVLCGLAIVGGLGLARRKRS